MPSRRGKALARPQRRIAPKRKSSAIPYFARRRSSAAFKKLDASGITGRGTDSTVAISEDREDRV
jgi:hypothetical protein